MDEDHAATHILDEECEDLICINPLHGEHWTCKECFKQFAHAVVE